MIQKDMVFIIPNMSIRQYQPIEEVTDPTMKHTAQNLIMVYNMVLHAIQQVQYQEKHSQKSQYILHLFDQMVQNCSTLALCGRFGFGIKPKSILATMRPFQLLEAFYKILSSTITHQIRMIFNEHQLNNPELFKKNGSTHWFNQFQTKIWRQ